MKYQIFINYRRQGGEFPAMNIYQRLKEMGYSVFYDVESLRSGMFNEQLYEHIEQAEAVVAVLPKNGLDRCIDDEKDWVRLELAHALKLRKKIIPVMLRGFEFPDNLPADIANIADCHGIDNAYAQTFDTVILELVKLLDIEPAGETHEKGAELMQLEEEAENGSAEANNRLGLVYEYGEYSGMTVFRDLKRALEYYQKAEKLGSIAAVYNIADVYEQCALDLTLLKQYGVVVKESLPSVEIKKSLEKQAEARYEMAAEKGYTPAIFKLGLIKEKVHEPQAAFSFYEKAAEKGFVPAINQLGWMYYNGIGTNRDIEKARVLYKQAASSGEHCAEAVYNYAKIIEKSDPHESQRLLENIAGEDGLAVASYALAYKYESIQDYRKAVQYYEYALNGGLREAEADLERCRNIML